MQRWRQTLASFGRILRPLGKPKEAQGWDSPLTTILGLFLFLRLTILFFYSPQGLFNIYTDAHHYYRIAQFSEQGYYPFVNMWYEYPPLLAYLAQAPYGLARLALPPGDLGSFTFQVFTRLLGGILLTFDAGVLILIYRIGERLWGTQKAAWLGWVYALSSLPLVYWSFSHQVVAVFFSLLAVWWLIEGKTYSSAFALGLGIAAKVTPLFLLVPLMRFLWPHGRRLALFALVVAIAFAGVYLPFFFLGGAKWVIASFTALWKVGSYGTLWAILDGNWRPGNYGEPLTRLDISQASVRLANPPLLPGWLSLALLGLLVVWLLWRRLDTQDMRQLLWFCALNALTFHLWLKGWSPQWALLLLPFLLLAFPDQRGLGWVLLLTFLILAEWPFVALFDFSPWNALFIIPRSLLFIWVCFPLVRQLRSPPVPS